MGWIGEAELVGDLGNRTPTRAKESAPRTRAARGDRRNQLFEKPKRELPDPAVRSALELIATADQSRDA